MRILLWHGYLLGGTGSNVYTRALAREWSNSGHDVTVVCQERHPERYDMGAAKVVVPELPHSLLPVFVLSGAFAPLEQLPKAVRYISEIFPLTHFCRAFRLVNMYHAAPNFYVADLVVLLAGAFITFLGASFLLKRIEQ